MKKKKSHKIINLAIEEDIGKKDITASLIPLNSWAEAHIVSQQKAVICGIDFVTSIFAQIDPKIKITWKIKDGAQVHAKKILCKLTGPARSLLTGERTALNFLQTLSSTSTLTNQFVTKLKGTKTKLLDTRKTIPGLRLEQKYAVKCGGGYNHRLGLYDAILIKENHVAACGSITNAVTKAKKLYPNKTIEVEVRNLKELRETLTTKANIIMLDNFPLKTIREAVRINNGKTKLEISGGVNLKNIHAFAKTGVDYISVGAITKTVMPIELSMLFVSSKNTNDKN
ncbi:MAG: carboxylating nicotinate-nucleotide diphosphorylase [Gammaproteobacteria bacterium]|nr:carboxylating nicotinate-nucleotide diphosphorylase [Gammaproteobacteria bacterium]